MVKGTRPIAALALALIAAVVDAAHADHPHVLQSPRHYFNHPWNAGDDHNYIPGGSDGSWQIWYWFDSNRWWSSTGPATARARDAVFEWNAVSNTSSSPPAVHAIEFIDKGFTTTDNSWDTINGLPPCPYFVSSSKNNSVVFSRFAYGGTSAPAVTWSCFNTGDWQNTINQVVVMNSSLSWHWYTTVPQVNSRDAHAALTHEVGHALGWEGTRDVFDEGGGDDGAGHFTSFWSPQACDLNVIDPTDYQVMCAALPTEEPYAQVSQREPGYHDLTATHEGSLWGECPEWNCGSG